MVVGDGTSADARWGAPGWETGGRGARAGSSARRKERVGRAGEQPASGGLPRREGHAEDPGAGVGTDDGGHLAAQDAGDLGPGLRQALGEGPGELDRKSTRLNSSH